MSADEISDSRIERAAKAIGAIYKDNTGKCQSENWLDFVADARAALTADTPALEETYACGMADAREIIVYESLADVPSISDAVAAIDARLSSIKGGEG